MTTPKSPDLTNRKLAQAFLLECDRLDRLASFNAWEEEEAWETWAEIHAGTDEHNIAEETQS